MSSKRSLPPDSRRTPKMEYVARYDVPECQVVAGQVFSCIEDVPSNVAVVPRPVDP